MKINVRELSDRYLTESLRDDLCPRAGRTAFAGKDAYRGWTIRAGQVGLVEKFANRQKFARKHR